MSAQEVCNKEVAVPLVGSMRRMLPFISGIAILACLLMAWQIFSLSGDKKTDDARIAADTVPVSTRLPGHIAHVYAQENAVIRQGDLLLDLDDRVLMAQLKQAEAEAAIARAQWQGAQGEVERSKARFRSIYRTANAMLAAARSEVGNSTSQVTGAQAALWLADLQANQAQIELDREKQLRAQGFVSQTAVDAARGKYETAEAALTKARAQLAAAQSQALVSRHHVEGSAGQLDGSAAEASAVTVAEASAKLAEARIGAAEAALELAKLNHAFRRVIAPSDGIITKLVARSGQFVQAGQPLLFIVPSATYVIANMKETQAGSIKQGQAVTISIDAYPDLKLKGKVSSIAAGTDASFSLLPPTNASSNFIKVVQRVPVRIELVEPTYGVALRVGLSVEVTIHTR